MRKVKFVNGEFYHIFNRGVDKRNIVMDEKDSERFLQGLVEFNTREPIGSIYENSFLDKIKGKPLVNIICYCLNPNHFHLVLEQVVENGISLFMKSVSLGYAKYFNNKYGRSGALFEGRFKVKHIDDNNYLLHTSAYVNLNDMVHRLGLPISKLIRSSWREDEENVSKGICAKAIIQEQFDSSSEYCKFALSNLPIMLQAKEDFRALSELFKE